MKVILLIILGLTIVGCCCSCAAIVGIKSYQSGDTKIDFVTGYGAEANVTASDTLNNNRAIKPGESYRTTN